MTDPVFHAFLSAQHASAMSLRQRTDRLVLLPMSGEPPSCYVARFACRGLVRNVSGGIEEHDEWAVGIRFPADYLRAEVRVPEVLTLLGPRTIFHPNAMPPFLCLHICAGTPLLELLHALWELLTWNVFSVGDNGLNKAASQWARQQPPGRFPIDRRPLFGRKD